MKKHDQTTKPQGISIPTASSSEDLYRRCSLVKVNDVGVAASRDKNLEAHVAVRFSASMANLGSSFCRSLSELPETEDGRNTIAGADPLSFEALLWRRPRSISSTWPDRNPESPDSIDNEALHGLRPHTLEFHFHYVAAHRARNLRPQITRLCILRNSPEGGVTPCLQLSHTSVPPLCILAITYKLNRTQRHASIDAVFLWYTLNSYLQANEVYHHGVQVIDR